MMPDRIGGREDDEGKPAVLVAVGKLRKPGMPSKIGGTGEDEEESEGGEGIDAKQVMKDAAREVISCIRRQDVEGLSRALEAHHRACDEMYESEKGEE